VGQNNIPIQKQQLIVNDQQKMTKNHYHLKEQNEMLSIPIAVFIALTK